ncbi:zinc finger protein 2-like isoform X2 [Pollicipes pollicipes]|uniref:zinc finger protein 2-like isoform X2 n=1 Tax=Pollicipes pollicipes TaxID=41117 RepID=UPI0018855A76|nr:zinc finger protein 2-like isoform X2 [Pollicipes pollicipes]
MSSMSSISLNEDDYFDDIYCPKEDPLYLGGLPISMSDAESMKHELDSKPPAFSLALGEDDKDTADISMDGFTSAPYLPASPTLLTMKFEVEGPPSPQPSPSLSPTRVSTPSSPTARPAPEQPQHYVTEDSSFPASGAADDYSGHTKRGSCRHAGVKDEDGALLSSRETKTTRKRGRIAKRRHPATHDTFGHTAEWQAGVVTRPPGNGTEYGRGNVASTRRAAPALEQPAATICGRAVRIANNLPRGGSVLPDSCEPEPDEPSKYPTFAAHDPVSIALPVQPATLTQSHRCGVYGAVFASENLLHVHARDHLTPVTHVCSTCSLSFVDRETLENHCKTHHTYESHKPRKRRRKEKTGPFQCADCDKVYSCRPGLYKHRRREHSGVARSKQRRCDDCGKLFYTESDLARHHRVEARTLYGCEVCHRSFSDELGLEQHRRTHVTCAPFPCGACRKLFDTVAELSQHYRQHPGLKSIRCDVCREAFLEKAHRAEHFRIHIDEKPFECGVCGKAYRLKKQLSRHLGAHAGSS